MSKATRILAQRDELAAWCKSLGIEPADTYLLEISIPASKPATMTVHQFARNEKGEKYLAWIGDEAHAARLQPWMLTIDSLPNVPAPEEPEHD